MTQENLGQHKHAKNLRAANYGHRPALRCSEAPPGYQHRWIRTALRGEEDKINVHSRLREGWEQSEPMSTGSEFASIDDGKHKELLETVG